MGKKNKSGDSSKGRPARAKESSCSCWVVLSVVIGLFVAGLAHLVHNYHDLRNVYPLQLQNATCLSDESPPFFLHCKDRESHNKKLLQKMMGKAKEVDASYPNEPFIQASVSYALAQSMRSQDKDLRDELSKYLAAVIQSVHCTKFIDVSSIDFQKETPRGLCAEAEYSDKRTLNVYPLELLNCSIDYIFLLAMYGSEFNEGTMRLTNEARLSFDGNRVNNPSLSGGASYFYEQRKTRQAPYMLLMDFLESQHQCNQQPKRHAIAALATELRKSLATMRRCSPPQNITWMEYHSRSIFKRASFEGKVDECGWANAKDTYRDILNLINYDFFFRLRRFFKLKD